MCSKDQRIFRFQPDENWGKNYGFNVQHKWKLPGVKCPICGKTWGTVGLNYPIITLPEDIAVVLNEIRSPVSPERLAELKDMLRLDPRLLLRPGTEFGPVEGSCYGRHGDFTWVNSWTPLISGAALEQVRERGIDSLVASPTQITPKIGKRFLYFELHIEPGVSLFLDDLPSQVRIPCRGCGRLQFFASLAYDYVFKVRKSMLPQKSDVFRIRELPTYVLVTERIMNVIKSLKLTNVVFSEMELV